MHNVKKNVKSLTFINQFANCTAHYSYFDGKCKKNCLLFINQLANLVVWELYVLGNCTTAQLFLAVLDISCENMISFAIISFITNGFTHHCHLGEPIVILGASEVILNFIPLFDEIHVSNLNSLRWDATFYGYTVCLCSMKRMPG